MSEIGETVTKKQQQRLSAYLLEYKRRIDITPGVKSLLYSLVCCEIEEEILQAYIDEHGTCYSAPSGFDKQRPQWQQLRDNRQRKTAIVSKLESLASHEVEPEVDTIAELRAQLD